MTLKVAPSIWSGHETWEDFAHANRDPRNGHIAWDHQSRRPSRREFRRTWWSLDCWLHEQQNRQRIAEAALTISDTIRDDSNSKPE